MEEDSDEEDVPELAPLYQWCEHLLGLNDFELEHIIRFVPEIAHVMWTCRRLRTLAHAQMDADMQKLRLTKPELLASIPEKSDQFSWYAETWRALREEAERRLRRQLEAD